MEGIGFLHRLDCGAWMIFLSGLFFSPTDVSAFPSNFLNDFIENRLKISGHSFSQVSYPARKIGGTIGEARPMRQFPAFDRQGIGVGGRIFIFRDVNRWRRNPMVFVAGVLARAVPSSTFVFQSVWSNIRRKVQRTLRSRSLDHRGPWS